MRKLFTPILTALALLFPSTAQAQTLIPLWAPTQVNAGSKPTLAEAAQFSLLSGWADQQVAGPRFWTYVKGTRSYLKNLPSSWYLTQDGVRVRDKVYGSYVMNPYSQGWQQYVASLCPKHCYLDGMGTSSITRTRPLLRWTKAQWVDGVSQELQTIVNAGIKVVPNSVGTDSLQYLSITHVASTEAWKQLNSFDLMNAGRIWVVAKGRCGYKLAEFLMEEGQGDRFSCHSLTQTAWTIPGSLKGKRIGKPLSPAVTIPGGYARDFTHAKVKVYTDGTYSIERTS